MAHELRCSFRQGSHCSDETILRQRSGEPEPQEMIGHVHAAVLGPPLVETAHVERQTHVWNFELLRQPHHCAKNGRHDMRVLVRIEMGNLQSRIPDFLDLGSKLGINIELTSGESRQNMAQFLRKRPSGKQRSPLHQHQMTTNIQRGCFKRQANGILKSVAVCHQRCRSQYAFAVRVNNAGIHVAGEAEIVGVNN